MCSSYDYDAPISEAGWTTPKYFQLRELLSKYLPEGETLPEPPAQYPVIEIPAITNWEVAPLFENLPEAKHTEEISSNICFRVREKNVDIKVVSPIAVHDKYWDADTLCYRRTTAVTAIEQKRVPEQIAAIIERAEKTFSEKADGKWMKQVNQYD